MIQLYVYLFFFRFFSKKRASLIAQLVKNLPVMQDTGSIPGSGRSAGEGISYPLQYSWASLVAQLIKIPPAMRETWVRSGVGKIPWIREGLPTPVFWPGEFQDCIAHGVAKSQTGLSDFHFHLVLNNL